MNAFKKFLGKYGDEIQLIAGIGQALIGSVAMPHDQREKVEKGVAALESAAQNIASSLPKIGDGFASAKEVAKSLDLGEVAKNLPGELLDQLVERVAVRVSAELGEVQAAEINKLSERIAALETSNNPKVK